MPPVSTGYTTRSEKTTISNNVLDIKYDSTTMTLVEFYNEYRSLLLNNVGRQNETIHWYPENHQVLEADKIVGPLFEDLILLNILTIIDPRLPAHASKS